MLNSERVKYIAFYYPLESNVENRLSVPSSVNKINYIVSALERIGISVEIISPAWTLNDHGLYRKGKLTLKDDLELTSFCTIGTKKKYLKAFFRLITLIEFTYYLLAHTKRNEIVIVYHSQILSTPLRIVKALKGINIILEVEENYSDISISKFFKKLEQKIFKAGDMYIFSTELLNESINHSCKPYIVSYGTYSTEKFIKKGLCDNIIHVVYAGTFSQVKGGVNLAINSALYLNKNYHVHIIGFGSPEEINIVEKLVSEVSSSTSCTLTYDGMLIGDNYLKFIQSCDIGLSTQVSIGKFSNTSFPSKILSYLSNGLRVVTVKIEVVERSKIGKSVYYYESETPESIAETVMSINLNEYYDSLNLIKTLDENFMQDLKTMLDGK